MKTSSTTFNEKCSFTADGVAYRRTFTDLPYAQEIWDIVTAFQGPPEEHQLARMRNAYMLPYFEARYLMTDRILKQSGIKQVLELAAGLSGRGLEVSKSPEVEYVEVDLPEKMALKQKVVVELVNRRQAEPRANLHLEPGNVLHPADLDRAASHFRRKEPIAVICEGLLRYLGFADKENLGHNIFRLVKTFGGMWITPDIAFLHEYETMTEERRARFDDIARVTGISVVPNLFRDEAHAVEFFASLGFKVEKHPLLEIADQLTAPKRLGLSAEAVTAVLRHRMTFVLT